MHHFALPSKYWKKKEAKLPFSLALSIFLSICYVGIENSYWYSYFTGTSLNNLSQTIKLIHNWICYIAVRTLMCLPGGQRRLVTALRVTRVIFSLLTSKKTK